MIVGAQSVDFIFEGFNESEKNLSIDGAASIIQPTGLLRLTDKTQNTKRCRACILLQTNTDA